MQELEYRVPYSLDNLITKIAQEGYTKDNFCLYTKEYEATATPGLTCYLERYPDVSDDLFNVLIAISGVHFSVETEGIKQCAGFSGQVQRQWTWPVSCQSPRWL